MKCVNALVAASTVRHQDHAGAAAALRPGPEALGVPSLALSGFLKIMTNRRVAANPREPHVALTFVDALVEQPHVRVVEPGPQHWGVFRGLVADYRLRANDIPDAYFAALAIERRATWVSLDQGFARFRELTWVNPADID